MLQSLDDVPWAHLGHAYGAATDVPQQLRALASSEAAVRAKAWYDLHGSLWHQGTVYEATAYAVPFFITALTNPDIAERERILAYLGLLANGSSYHDVHQHLQIFADERSDPDFRSKIAGELVWVKAVREAVRAGAATFAALLGDADPALRAGAAYLLGHFDEDGARNGAWIRRHVTAGEPDAMARAACVLAIGMLGRDHARWIGDQLQTDDCEAVRVAAALGLAWLLRSDAPEAACRVLERTVRGPSAAHDVFDRLPWHEADARTYCSEALALIGRASGQSLAALLGGLAGASAQQSEAVVGSVLQLVFPNLPPATGLSFDRFNADQQAVVHAIADCHRFWALDIDVGEVMRAAGFDVADFQNGTQEWDRGEILEHFGLPGKRAQRRAFIERQDGRRVLSEAS